MMGFKQIDSVNICNKVPKRQFVKKNNNQKIEIYAKLSGFYFPFTQPLEVKYSNGLKLVL